MTRFCLKENIKGFGVAAFIEKLNAAVAQLVERSISAVHLPFKCNHLEP